METNGNGEKREKWFESRLTFMIFIATALVGAVLAIYIPMGKIQTDIAVINSNHEVHIQDALIQIQKLEAEQTSQNTKIEELLKQTVETQTLIKIHMGVK